MQQMSFDPIRRLEPIIRSEMPELDSVRGIAILMVLLYHGFYWSNGLSGLTGIANSFVRATSVGWLGVNLFFVLSGFLITGILLDSKLKEHFYSRFYTRRILRILPAYYAILILLFWNGLRPRIFLLYSFFFLANVSSLFGVMPAYNVLWSLAVEEHFYIFWPSVVHKFSTKTVERIAIGIVCIVPCLRACTFLLGWMAGLSAFTWLVADGLAMGAWLAICVRKTDCSREKLTAISAGALGVAIFAIVVGGRFGILTRLRLAGATFEFSCANLVFLGFLGFVLLAGTSKWKFLVQRPMLRFYGYISYGLYLIHLLVFETYDKFVRNHWSQLPPSIGHFGIMTLRFAVCAGVSTGLAYLSRRYFEEPFLRMKDRFARTTIASTVNNASD
jgi:peptidoglycan/LPS O-acetylase OafA/YrhL